MSLYYSFNDFMSEVIQKADAFANKRNGVGLEYLFNVSSITFNSTKRLIAYGWAVFIAVAALLALGPIGFGIAIIPFLTTPLGIAVAVIFGGGAIGIIRTMYRDKILPKEVKAVGEMYKPQWEDADGNNKIVDKLMIIAAEDLYSRAVRALQNVV